MAPDDRDQAFEKALARHLRSSASSSPDANALAGATGEACPDPELLAAYHDGSLSSEERNLWKQHVMGCDNCQLVLAHLATPLEIPVNLPVNHDVRENVLAASQKVSNAAAASPASIARPSPAHSLRWLWLVPAGAIAATLIAWVSLQERKPVPLAPSSSVEVAENRQSPAVAPPTQPAPALSRDREESKEPMEKDQSAPPSAAGAGSENRDLALKRPRNQIQLAQQSPSQAAGKPAHGPYISQQKQEQQIGRIVGGNAGAFDQKKSDAPSAYSTNGRAAESFAPKAIPSPAPPPPSLEQPGFLTEGSVAALKDKAPSVPAPAPPPASNPSASKSKVEAADAISAATETVEVSAARASLAKTSAQEHAPERAQALAMMRAAALQNARVLWAPSGKQAWRIGPAGSLEYSKDKGLNWITQISGVYTDLLAGSAPSAKVCWIVGASGTILRTTDAGTHWTKLHSPVTNDLVGVRATDGRHARIWFAPDQKTDFFETYETVDGGFTWSPFPNKQY
jgi:hypothetical protein